MSFLSKVADFVRGEYELSCYTDPGLETSYGKEGTAHKATKRGINIARSQGQEDSKGVGMKYDPTKSNIYSEKPPRTNKIIQYVSGEMDVLCFAPSPEDFQSASIRTSVGGLLTNATDDEDDDLISIDVGNKYRPKRSGGTSRNIASRANISMSKESFSDGHRTSTIMASTQKYSTMDHHDLPNSRNPTNMINETQISKSYNSSPNSSDHAGSIKESPQTYSLITHPNLMSSSDTHNYHKLEKNLSFEKNRQVIGIKKDRPSPTTVTTGFAARSNTDTHVNNSNSFVNVDAAGSSFLKDFYNRGNENFIGNLLDLDDADPKVTDIHVQRERTFDFESAGFSPEEALMIKRRIKLQKLVRSLNANLSE